MFTIKQEREALILLFFGAVVSLFLFFLHNNKLNSFVVSPISPPNVPSLAPTPTIDPLTQSQTMTSDSPDGKLTLTMKREPNRDLQTYTFSVTDNTSKDTKSLFSTTVPSRESFSLPLNAWSPDYKYVFFKDQTGTDIKYQAMTTSGNPIREGEQTVILSDLFHLKYPDYQLIDVTGWAAPTLLILNTTTNEGKPLSLWFDIPSQSFIPLATLFR